MRTTQMVGLRPEALDWLNKNCKYEEYDVCPHCCRPTKSKLIRKPSGKHVGGMFCEEFYELGIYLVIQPNSANRSTVHEVEQCSPWSSGPMLFLCLEDNKGERLFEWTEEEINMEMQ